MYAAADRLTVLPPTLELRVLPRVLSDRARLAAGRRLCGPAAARARAARHSARDSWEKSSMEQRWSTPRPESATTNTAFSGRGVDRSGT